jgi:hypothetical protein
MEGATVLKIPQGQGLVRDDGGVEAQDWTQTTPVASRHGVGMCLSTCGRYDIWNIVRCQEIREGLDALQQQN